MLFFGVVSLGNYSKCRTTLTLADDDRVFSDDAFECECDDDFDVVSVGAVAVVVVPDALVTWSAGSDSGTVCNVVRIVADIVAYKIELLFFSSFLLFYIIK